MVTETRTVTVERGFEASPEAVFDAWTDPARAGRWLFRTEGGVLERCEIEARVGGGFRIDERRGAELAEHFGAYVEIERPSRIAFDFWTSFSDERTRVTIDIAPEGEGARLTLTHEGVWADYEERTRQGWAAILEGLGRILESKSKINLR
jgi:uncharacterized protein YndB with AHSA1/START domain